jgi:hypothetical protein
MTCDGKLERVMVLEKGFAWNGETYGSLSQIAKAMTGTNWNGHRFFGLRMEKSGPAAGAGRRERIGNANAPPDAASIGPISDRVIRCGDASLARASRREIAMLHRRDGATIGDLTAAAGWLSHTTRGDHGSAHRGAVRSEWEGCAPLCGRQRPEGASPMALQHNRAALAETTGFPFERKHWCGRQTPRHERVTQPPHRLWPIRGSSW